MFKKNSILFYSILFYSVNIEAKNVVKDFFIKGEKIITWNGISSTSIQMYNEYCKGFSEKNNEKLKEEFSKLFTYYDDTEIRYIKNKYELVRNLFSFSFYCKKQFSQAGFFVFNFNFLDNTNLRQSERIFLEKNELTYEPGSGRIGILSFLFGIGFYWLKKNNFNISSSFNLGFIWTRDNAMQIPNYKYNRNPDKEDGIDCQYYGCLNFYFDNEGNLVTRRSTLEFLPFHYFTWMHGDILFKFEILSIQYKHFYIGCTWKRGIFDTIKVLKYKWWKCLPSTISIEIGYILK